MSDDCIPSAVRVETVLAQDRSEGTPSIATCLDYGYDPGSGRLWSLPLGDSKALPGCQQEFDIFGSVLYSLVGKKESPRARARRCSR